MDRDAIRRTTQNLKQLFERIEGSSTGSAYRISVSRDPNPIKGDPKPDSRDPKLISTQEQNILVCYGRIRGLDTLLGSGEFKKYDSVVYVLSDQKYFIFDSDRDREVVQGDSERLNRRIASRHNRLRDLVLNEAGKTGIPILVSSGDVATMDRNRIFDYGPIVSTEDLGTEQSPTRVLAVYGDRADWDRSYDGRGYDILVSKDDGLKAIVWHRGSVIAELESTNLPRAVSIGVSGSSIVDVRDTCLKYSGPREREYVGKFWSNWVNARGRIDKKLGKGSYRGTGPMDSFFDGFVGFCGMDPSRLSGKEAGVFWDFITDSFRKHYPDKEELEEFFKEFNRLQMFELGATKR